MYEGFMGVVLMVMVLLGCDFGRWYGEFVVVVVVILVLKVSVVVSWGSIMMKEFWRLSLGSIV